MRHLLDLLFPILMLIGRVFRLLGILLLGVVSFLGDNILSWSSKLLEFVIREFHTPLMSVTLVCCDNVNVIYLTTREC